MLTKKWRVSLQRLSYAKGESDAVAKLHNRFEEKDKKERQKHNKLERGGFCHLLSCIVRPGSAPPWIAGCEPQMLLCRSAHGEE